MRRLYKFHVAEYGDRSTYQAVGSNFEEHAKNMGGYEATDAYVTKEAFFERYFFGYQRIKSYDYFIQKNLNPDQEVLSIGSGRCANELKLMEEGYRVTCSELGIPEAYKATRKLFPKFDSIQLDILSGPSQKKYGAILSLSVVFLFDPDNLHRFFSNAHASLLPGGSLIIDVSGAPDNLLALLLRDVYLKYEAKGIQWFKTMTKRKRHMVATEHNGYRWNASEFLEIAGSCGFELVYREDYEFLHEFQRSYVLRQIMNRIPISKGAFGLLGKHIPYERMFNLRKA